ncbi:MULTISPECIES: DUF1294 domain-containing protein [Oceanobacillus]|uniref:DUF1294 domain-containing protein n=1 Tax=Oceanobacillus kimchii TaxID=746691 RepID=A0ABQ5TKH0_9BACI|nr:MULTISPECIES: DUF1294 domain-containing protein [Oceanobacillus]MBT2600854.1 DUF1294 domain-containing protein [Oceanobacillus sp. ISL-74]MBT2650749.1 DUF1294 domain-containing protein [Oceanobacillus sp. ISL-73]MCT1575609.1 DUF1294 domain-containing protein [Oceanobacillus kimchii]MCT2137240.1 DUF1294 domain-containing protein [Oceanobacillus kimchii]OEH55421.1 hypothetical protein AQ616_04390 [Oceanobacillus sp. E9]
MEEWGSILYYLVAANIIGFVMMYIDKKKAVRRHYRIPERTFWLLGIIGGSVGIYIGMQSFRHKTKHRSFTIGMPVLIVINVISFSWILLFMS